VDCHGRVADLAIVRALGWDAGTRLDIRVAGGLILLSTRGVGAHSLTGQGYVQLPVNVRRSCGLKAGDRVLLAAEPTDGLLTMHPPVALDAMLTWLHVQVLGGDPA
jgi:bifunctional DNA-binding transcriptional regulator/antitoxin component of YhaV-PrlF toxin-antitoxin module